MFNNNTTFSDRIKKYSHDKLTKQQRIAIEKKKYLVNKESDIIQAKKEGYAYYMIAEVATIELLESGVPKSFSVKNKDGQKMTYETKIRVADIKKICEPESDTNPH